MTLLGRQAILERIKTNELYITPYEEKNVRVASIDLRLGNELLWYASGQVCDPERGFYPSAKRVDIRGGYTLKPGKWVLGATLEKIGIPHDLSGILSGKSTRAREGLSVEDAGYVDPDWWGNLTVEIKNQGPLLIILRPGMLICQIRFEVTEDVGEKGYDKLPGSHYARSIGPVQPVYADFRVGSLAVDRYGRTRYMTERRHHE